MTDGAFGNLNSALQNLTQYNQQQQTLGAAGAGLSPFGSSDGSGGSSDGSQAGSGQGGSDSGSGGGTFGASGVPLPTARPFHPVGAAAAQMARAQPYYGMYQEASNHYGVPLKYMLGQGNIESESWNPDVISGKRKSPTGAIGIAQFEPGTVKMLNKKWGTNFDPTNPQEAIDAQARFMRENYDRAVSYGLKGDAAWHRAISDYNPLMGGRINTSYVNSVVNGRQGLWGAGTWQQAIDKGLLGNPSDPKDVNAMAAGQLPGSPKPGLQATGGVNPGTLTRSDVNASSADPNAFTPGTVMDKVMKGTATWDELSPQQQQALTQKFGSQARARFEASQKQAATTGQPPNPTERPPHTAPGDIAGTGRDQPYNETAAFKTIASGDTKAIDALFNQEFASDKGISPSSGLASEGYGRAGARGAFAPSSVGTNDIATRAPGGTRPSKDEPVPSDPNQPRRVATTDVVNRNVDEAGRPYSGDQYSSKDEPTPDNAVDSSGARIATQPPDTNAPGVPDTKVAGVPYTPGDGSKADKAHAETIGLDPKTGMPKGYDPTSVYPPGFTLPQLIYNIKKANPKISNAALARAVMYLSPLLNQASQANYHQAQIQAREEGYRAGMERTLLTEEGKNVRADKSNATRLQISQASQALRKQEFDARQSQQWKEFVGKQDLSTKRIVISEARLKEQIQADAKRIEQGNQRVNIQQFNSRLRQWEDLNNQLNKAITMKSQTAGALAMDEATRKALLQREEERFQAVQKQIEAYRSGLATQDVPASSGNVVNYDDLVAPLPAANAVRG